jgi:hypothetical protein
MEIKLVGKSSIFLEGKKESALINPSENELKDTKYNSRIVLFTSGDFSGADLKNDRILIRGSGEYEIGGVEITGINGEDGNTVYRIIMDGFIIIVLGDIKQGLTPKRIERLDSTDILLAPVKIGEVLSFKLVKEWAKKWGANYLIPIGDEGESLKLFLDAADEEGLEKIESLKLEKPDELPDGLEIKLLKKVE